MQTETRRARALVPLAAGAALLGWAAAVTIALLQGEIGAIAFAMLLLGIVGTIATAVLVIPNRPKSQRAGLSALLAAPAIVAAAAVPLFGANPPLGMSIVAGAFALVTVILAATGRPRKA